MLPIAADPDPSPIGLFQTHPAVGRLRVRDPAVRRGWLEGGPTAGGEGRGREPFVTVDWDTATRLVAEEVARVRDEHGNTAIFGGSYGWSSAGRFHHAQSQVHRFLNAAGGYVRHVDTYSLGAGRAIMPHIVAPMDELNATHTTWDVLAEHTGLFVAFGGIPLKNTQISSGGAGDHRVRAALARMAARGARFINISPVRDNLDTGGPVEWIPIRPNTDTALMLALAHGLHAEGLLDRVFLDRYCTGFATFLPYLTGQQDGIPKDARWAAAITGIPAARIEALAREMAGARTMVNAAYALQRASHGEQPFWMLVTLASMLGQIGLPGGGFGVGYGAMNAHGSAHPRFGGPTLPQGRNGVDAFIPVARLTDMLLHPGEAFTYNGRTHAYPDIRLVYWAGGNPFHHHQDLNRLLRAWRGKPETIVVHEQFWTPAAKHADIVLPATTSLERNDIGYSTIEGFLIAMRKAAEPPGQARDDYAIFAAIAGRLGLAERFTEGLDEAGWLRRLYAESVARAEAAGIALPPFDAFWEQGLIDLSSHDAPGIMLQRFRQDPAAHRLHTPSGRIEIASERIAGFAVPDCPGHPVWLPPHEWLGARRAAQYPLHLLSDQPARRLHSQLDHSPHSLAGKIAGREPVYLNPGDAAARGIADGTVVELFNDRGRCLAAAIVTADLMPGVCRLATGAWFDPEGDLEKHGNPNVLTLDVGTSGLTQGCSAQSCLVEARPWVGALPPVTAHVLPTILPRRGGEGFEEA
ncbi:MAG: molybdopterin-dependent oxidoreductase [Acetobacteraceae bacterium]